jgi:two-component system sensor kinase FixL
LDSLLGERAGPPPREQQDGIAEQPLDLAQALAHELRQPLTALTLYLDTARRALLRQGETGCAIVLATMLEKARRETERVSAVIRAMRALNAGQAPQRQPVELNALVDEAVELARIDRCGHARIVRLSDAGLPRLALDPVQIQQVVVNLVRNALQAVDGRDAGEVRIATVCRSRSVTIEVADDGPGVAPEARARLFHPVTSTKPEGLGLGLAISRAIARAHGGDLEFEPGSGCGAIFTLRLPLPEFGCGTSTRRSGP